MTSICSIDEDDMRTTTFSTLEEPPLNVMSRHENAPASFGVPLCLSVPAPISNDRLEERSKRILASVDFEIEALREVQGKPIRGERIRSPAWTAEEKGAYLRLKVEGLRAVKGNDWDFISKGLRERHGFERRSKCCEDLWGTLRKNYKAVRDHEASKRDPVTSNCVSYWEMGDDERSRNKLPRLFSWEWCEMMEMILAAQEKRFVKMGRGISVQQYLADGDADRYSSPLPANPLGDGSDEHTSRMTHPALIASLVDDVINSLRPHVGNRKRSGATTDEGDLISQGFVGKDTDDAVGSQFVAINTDQELRDGSSAISSLAARLALSSLFTKPPRKNQAIWQETNSMHAEGKMPGATIDEGDLTTRLAPDFKKHIEDALDHVLWPVASVLHSHGEAERKRREVFLALEEKKLALRREKIQLKRRRVDRFQPTRRTSSTKSSLLRNPRRLRLKSSRMQ